MLTGNHSKLAAEDLEHDLRSWGVAVTISELDPKSRTVTVLAPTYTDFILARVELKLRGLTAVRPS